MDMGTIGLLLWVGIILFYLTRIGRLLPSVWEKLQEPEESEDDDA
jgi:hypothetical protein